MESVKKSKSPCLKINTWEGIITWKCATKELRFDPWIEGPDEFELSKRFEEYGQSFSNMMNPEAARKKMFENAVKVPYSDEKGKNVFYQSQMG